ncbi:MAG: hypothetical protein AAGF58_16595, partial [Pseudomonadota bacterium]
MTLRAVAALLLLVGVIINGSALAQVPLGTTGSAETVQVIGEPSPNDIRELARLLGDPTVVNWLEQRAAGLIGEEEAAGLTFEESLERALVRIQQRVARVGVALALLPQTPTIVATTWEEELSARERLNLVVLLIIFFFIGAGLEWLYWRYAGQARRKIELRRSDTYLSKSISAVSRFALTAGGALCFALGTIGTFVLFEWPPGAREFVLDLLLVVVLMRLVAALALFALAPRVEALRLVPLSRYDARVLYSGVMVTAAVILFGGALAETTVLLGGNRPAGLAIDIVTGAFATVLAIMLLWLMHARSRLSQRHVLMPVIGTAVIVMLFILWLIGAYRIAGTLAIIALLVPTARLLRKTIHHAFQEDQSAAQDDVADEKDDDEEITSSADQSLYQPVAIRVGRFAVAVTGILLIGLVWGVQPWSVSATDTMLGTIVRVLV